ncbi:MAG: class I SAM-dependent methyltransferase [Jannaschia sp.]
MSYPLGDLRDDAPQPSRRGVADIPIGRLAPPVGRPMRRLELAVGTTTTLRIPRPDVSDAPDGSPRIYRKDAMSTSETFWDRSASTYDKTEGRFERIHGRARESAKRHLKKSDIVLDYGCGTGTTACAISGSVRSVRAIDISTAMIDIARGKAAAGGVVNVEFGRADIFDEGFEPGSFDAVLAFNMLHTEVPLVP